MTVEAVAAAAPRPAPPGLLDRSITVGSRTVIALDVAAAGVIGAGLVLQAWAQHAAGPDFDDVRLQAATARRGLVDVLGDSAALTPAGLSDVHDLGGPLTRGAVRLLAEAAPLRGLPIVAGGLLLRALLALSLWLLLRRLLRPSAALLVPLGVVASSPALLVAGTGMLRVFGPLAAVTATCWAAVALVRTSGGWRVGGVAVASALAIGADRVGAITPLVLLALALTFPGDRVTPRPAARHLPVPERLEAPAISAVVVIVALAVPALRPRGVFDPVAVPGAADVLTALTTVLGGLVGAPWHRSSRLLDVLLTVTAATVVGALVGGALAIGVRRAPRQAARAVALGAVWGGGSALLGLSGPAETAGAVLGLTAALTTMVSLALLPERSPGRGEAGSPGPAWRGLAVLPLVVLLLAVPATASAAQTARQEPLAAWLDQVRTSLEGLRPFPRIAARAVPSAVTGSPEVTVFDSDVVTLLRPDALVHDADGPQSALDDTGRLGPARFGRLGGTARGPLCLASVQAGQAGDARVPFAKRVSLPSDAQVRLEVLVTGTTRLDVLVEDSDGRTAPVRRWSDDLFYEGPHTVVLPTTTRTAVAVRVRPASADAGVCVVAADLVRVP